MSAQVSKDSQAPVSSDLGPGRGCPLDYRYSSQSLAKAPNVPFAEVLWVVGGLYGNVQAMHCINALVAAEQSGLVQVVANGDFHWFDADPQEFRSIEHGTQHWLRMRGNVETELARLVDESLPDAGCGCGYPASVPQDDVDRSNLILQQLRRNCVSSEVAARLAALPCLSRAQVGRLRVGIVHGDDQSLAGWRLAEDALADSVQTGLIEFFESADIDLIASSHTCLPVASTFDRPADLAPVGLINNGAAGMANFAGSTHGVVTRIARAGLPPPSGARVLYRAQLADCEVCAVAVDFDLSAFLARFDQMWPAGSPASQSYRHRILHGPDYPLTCAPRGAFRPGL